MVIKLRLQSTEDDNSEGEGGERYQDCLNHQSKGGRAIFQDYLSHGQHDRCDRIELVYVLESLRDLGKLVKNGNQPEQNGIDRLNNVTRIPHVNIYAGGRHHEATGEDNF